MMRSLSLAGALHDEAALAAVERDTGRDIPWWEIVWALVRYPRHSLRCLVDGLTHPYHRYDFEPGEIKEDA